MYIVGIINEKILKFTLKMYFISLKKTLVTEIK